MRKFVPIGLIQSNIFGKVRNFCKSEAPFHLVKSRGISISRILDSSINLSSFYEFFLQHVNYNPENAKFNPYAVKVAESFKAAQEKSEESEDDYSFIKYYHTFIDCYYGEGGAKVFFDEMDKALSGKTEAEKKTLVNGMLYIMASSIQDDRESFGQFIEKYGQYIDFESSYVASKQDVSDPFVEFKNNLFKCLIYNELWNVLDLVFDAASKKSSVQYVRQVMEEDKIPSFGGNIGLHKDASGKYDLSALIINGAPKPIIEKYVELARDNLGKINLFEADQHEGLSIVDYAIFFGRSDVLEMLMPQIQKQLARDPSNQQIINNAHDVVAGRTVVTEDGIKGVLNHILLANGCDRSFGLGGDNKDRQTIDATSRSMGFDFPLRGMLATYCRPDELTKDHGTDQEFREYLYSTASEHPFHKMLAPYPQGGYLMHGEEILKQTRLEFACSGHAKCEELLPRKQIAPRKSVVKSAFEHLSDAEPSKMTTL